MQETVPRERRLAHALSSNLLATSHGGTAPSISAIATLNMAATRNLASISNPNRTSVQDQYATGASRILRAVEASTKRIGLASTTDFFYAESWHCEPFTKGISIPLLVPMLTEQSCAFVLVPGTTCFMIDLSLQQFFGTGWVFVKTLSSVSLRSCRCVKS
ncbi:unnamed protein product [Mortierella alpina]